MVQLFLDGGGFMIPILLVFIFGLSFVGERIYHLTKGLGADYNFAVEVADAMKTGGKDSAMSMLEDGAPIGPVANLCYTAAEKSGEGVAASEKALDQTAGIEMASLEKNMTWISLSIATAPMFGFLGTVWGMIQAFNDIKTANDISPAVVAGGISVALLTTAFGLVVALILQFLQNLVMYIIDNQIVNMQKSTATILDSIKEKYN